MQLNATRHPYSFNGDAGRHGNSRSSLAGAGTPEGAEPTWHESLLGYCGGDERQRSFAESSMRALGEKAGVKLDYNVQTYESSFFLHF